MTPLFLSLLGSLCVVAAAIPYAYLERRWRWRWQEVAIGRAPAHDEGVAPYRDGGTVALYAARAPGAIRLAAFGSLLLGQLFMPGVMLALYSFFAAYGLGVLAVPGLIVAAKLYSAGRALLVRQPRESYFVARSAARWSLRYHVVATPLVLLMGLTCRSHLRAEALLVIACSSTIWIAQALQLGRAVCAHEDALFAATAAELPPRALAGRLPFRDRFG
jgi:hypothetical protein